MNRILHKTVIVGALCLASHQAAAINIQFDYTRDSNDFFNTAEKRAVLAAAGSFFSGIILDDLTAINSAGSNNFTAVFSNPGTGSTENISNFDVAADTLIIYAGGRILSGSTLGVGGPGGSGVSGTSSFVNNAVSRGEIGDTQGPTATDFAPWGGSIAFDTDSSWYFDSDLSTAGDIVGNDFYSIALHEIGHLLGLGISDSWDNLVSGTDFTGVASTGIFGNSVPLASGLSHWANGTMGMVDGMMQEAAMDPSITTGTRKFFTDLDRAALADIGWDVAPIPVPAAVWLFGSGLIGLVAVARRRS